MPGYRGLAFDYADMLVEINRMESLSSQFVAPHSEGVLARCYETLENIRHSTTTRTQFFEISDTWPLRTIDSCGEYRASGRTGGRCLYGTLSFRWEVQNPNAGSSRQKEFYLIGESSINIRLHDAQSDEQLAQWQIESGDATSPGCHFHSAVNQRLSQGLFPEWLKVPRFPSMLVSPMDGLEFLLGELFQLRWNQTVSTDSDAKNTWATCQRRRLERVLTWKLQQVRNADTTPWMAIKKAKPDLRLLVDR
ncbi:MAG: hypothetical protein U0992_18425 [Planctomycetaceae bacterium]